MSDNSSQNRRVYVGNLSYDVKWHQLKDFMRQAGEVVHADVLQLANGRSKGCGIVEYATAEDAQRAVETLSNQTLMGRLIFVREDREVGPPGRGAASSSGPNASAAPPSSSSPSINHNSSPGVNAGCQLFVSNLPYSVGWQDLKDLFRQCGSVIRADIQMNYARRSKGTGIVLYESAEAAQDAIDKFNGYDWNGRTIEVREDRYAKPSPTLRDGTHSGSSSSGSFRPQAPKNEFTDNAHGNGEQSETIFIGNLPWSTTNGDLLELFQTIGTVERAEVQLLPNGRAAGNGVVKFGSPESADEAINKLNGYNYGSRDLVISYVAYS